ncbi:hypothetical protein B0A69_18495 [Chryseobacterium shigense]|uniref:DUF5640 domain-containing protein n=1 Tax=Chryseobacterium shigense TaxID=297244 RepID=A0A1N7K2C0_9FLAO|nr:hypothetical protein [Chryseobacterium shigense]PQA91071.1 hypothetical protein B0A69_18495 [Chryseobacterium shigense]SIS55686.1 hypothetical protein SAMN05421639_10822 [Chryseobacterium shigense]
MMKSILIILGCILAFNCHSQKKKDPQLIGKWGGVLEFTKDGQFRQHLGEGKMQNTIESTFDVQNNKIISVDRDTKETSESQYSIKNDTLTILYEGMENKYIRLK